MPKGPMAKDDHKAKIHHDADTSNWSVDNVVKNVASLDCPGVDMHNRSAVWNIFKHLVKFFFNLIQSIQKLYLILNE